MRCQSCFFREEPQYVKLARTAYAKTYPEDRVTPVNLSAGCQATKRASNLDDTFAEGEENE